MAALESFPPGPSSTGPTWPAQMTRRLGESLFLLNNRRITSDEHASEVAQVLDRIVNSESHGAVSKILALDTLRDAGLIGDAQLAAQKSIVLARRAASAAMRGASAGAPETDGETDGETDPWAFMAPEDGQRLATRVDRARADDGDLALAVSL